MSLLLLLGLPIGITILLYHMWKHKDLVRVQWNSVASFVGFMTLVFFLRLAWMDFIYHDNMPALQQFLKTIPLKEIEPYRFALVFWEDSFFVLPIYWAMKKLSKWKGIAVAVLLSGLFGYGHMYEGYIAVALLSLYPYHISYKNGLKYGFGTIMVCHILYDFMTFYFIKILPYLL